MKKIITELRQNVVDEEQNLFNDLNLLVEDNGRSNYDSLKTSSIDIFAYKTKKYHISVKLEEIFEAELNGNAILEWAIHYKDD